MPSVASNRRQSGDRRCWNYLSSRLFLFFFLCRRLGVSSRVYTAVYLTHLPPVPAELIQYSLDMDQFFYGGNPARKLLRNGVEFEAGLNRRHDLNPALDDWIRKNVISDWHDAGYSRTTGPCHGPHIDRSRFFTLQYIIDPGGDNVATVFYRSRTQKLDMEPGWFYINNYDQIESIEHQFIPAGVWVLLNARNHIHSVENIQTTRVSIQIGLMKDPMDEIFFHRTVA